jgi:hypothetical protein
LISYLSRPYRQRTQRIFLLCHERDLEVWFYDEFPDPTGAAGGAIPELCRTALP